MYAEKINYSMIFYYWTKYLVLYPEALKSKRSRSKNQHRHSAAGEESPIFIKFLTQHIINFNLHFLTI